VITRTAARRRFEQLRGQGDAAAGALRSLLREWQQAAASPVAEPPWRVAAAATFVELLRQEAGAGLPPGTGDESRERLDDALLQGPAALLTLARELDARIQDSDRFRVEMELLRARRRCQQLRLRCLDHLDAIFHGERAQP
jgi:phytoene dehydrogenase-like protein